MLLRALGRLSLLCLTWMDSGGERTATILTIVATCIAHDINPRAYLHLGARPEVSIEPLSRPPALV